MDGDRDGELAAALREVVERYGRQALADPVALRAALRSCRPDLPATDRELLAGMAGSDLAGALRSAGSVDELVDTVSRRPADPLPTDTSPTWPQTAPDAGTPRIAWDAEPEVATVAQPTRPRWRRPVLAIGLAVAVVAAVLLVRGGPGQEPAAPDRYALDQVAQRYRALGATLLDGALRCSPVAPQPGEVERLDCDFGTWTMTLSEYDSAGRLHQERDRELLTFPDSVRTASTAEPDAAVVLTQTLASVSQVYWDVDDPRPVAAVVNTAELTFAELAAFYDARGFAAVARPEVPGAAFTSPVLFDLAKSLVWRAAGQCAPVVDERIYDDSAEQVECTFPNGVRAEFVMAKDEAGFFRFRAVTANPEGALPGSLRLGGWNRPGRDEDPLGHQLIEYVRANGEPVLYFDARESLAFGRLVGPGLTQDQLSDFWINDGI